MDDEIPVIAENPFTLIVAFEAVREVADLLQIPMNGVGNGLILAGIGTRTDHEVIGEGGDAREIEHQDVRCLSGLCGPNGEKPAGLFNFV